MIVFCIIPIQFLWVKAHQLYQINIPTHVTKKQSPCVCKPSEGKQDVRDCKSVHAKEERKIEAS